MSSLAFIRTASTGNWNTAGTWSPSGVPANGDTIHVPSGVTVTVNCNCGTYTGMVLYLEGTMDFNNGAKINMAADGVLIMPTGSKVTGGNGGSKFNIGSAEIYRGNGPDLNGPQVCGSAGCDGTDPPNFLPVDLTSFIVKMMDDKAHLEWKTESELNNSHFIVERYMENAEWVAIGQIMGNGTTNEMHFYEYDDYNVNPYESAYYRLVQVDFDGVSKTHFAVKAEALKIQGHQYRIY